MTNYSTWMSNDTVQGLTLSALKIPGTHDSGSYSLTTGLSQIEYGNIAFLWNLNAGSAPLNGQYPWPTKADPTLYVGPAMYQFVMNTALGTSISQDQSILSQLQGGIRYFDLRIYYDSNLGDYYVQHGLIGCSLGDIVNQVASFINENAGGQELIFIEISHTNFTNTTISTEECTDGVIDLLTANLPSGSLYTLPNSDGQTFDFQSLASLTVSDITASSGSGVNTVIVLNTDSGYLYPNTVLNTSGFADSGRSASGVDQISQLISAEQPPLQANPQGNLYQIAWTLTPLIPDIVSQVINNLSESDSQASLQTVAGTANAGLYDFIQDNSSCAFNLMTVDWYENISPNVVDIAISLNTTGSMPSTSS